MSTEYVYTQGDILVESYNFLEILSLKIERKMNEHAKLNISGIISNENLDKYVEVANESSNIKVSVKDNQNNIKDLFQGVVTNIGISSINDVRTLEIEALSHTFSMDIEKKSRSFQGENLTYKEIFNSINSSYSNIQMIDNASAGHVIDKIVVQLNETDWEFLKRLASHFNVQLIAECILPGIKYSIGRDNGGSLYSLDEFNYSVNKGLKEYKINSKNSNYGLNDIDLVSYEIKTNTILDLYNTVSFKDRCLYVYECEMAVEEGILYNKYSLRNENGIKIRKIFNDGIAGMSLNSKILDCSSDVVKLSLEIDGYKNPNAVWLPYSTVFSSPDGTGWYCMPEVGDSIRLYFPDNKEENAYAISSVNVKSSNQQKRSDPSVKSIGTKHGKEIIMRPGAVDIRANGNLFMTLTDGQGIVINSDQKIILDAKEDIEINGKKVSITGKESIDLIQAGASINIKDDVTMSGSKINTQ